MIGVLLAVSLGSVFADDPASAIVAEGKERSQCRFLLETLCGQFGARLTSSVAIGESEKWAVRQFRSFGCKNVHLEKWGEFPVGFDRARTGHVARVVAPFQREMQFTTPSWTPGTKGLRRGLAVLEPLSRQELDTMKARLRGAYMVMRPRGGAGLPDAKTRQEIQSLAFKHGVIATISGSATEQVETGGLYRIDWHHLPSQTWIQVRKSDYESIQRGLQKGKVVLEFDIRQTFRQGPIPNYNVVAEIPGTEKPDEVVVVGAHLDSWDGPGSEGAMDNGKGCAVTLEAARILMASGVKPKRTIRFILWSGEEQGLLGSTQYVVSHKAELPKISCCFVDDGGANYWRGFVGLESHRAFFQATLDRMNQAFPCLPMVFSAVAEMPMEGGSDDASFAAFGVPAFFPMLDGVADYEYVHHTQHDRVEAAIDQYLIQSSTAAALSAFDIANAEIQVPRAQKL